MLCVTVFAASVGGVRVRAVRAAVIINDDLFVMLVFYFSGVFFIRIMIIVFFHIVGFSKFSDSNSMNSREATIALNMLPKIGPVKVRSLLAQFGSPENILDKPLNQLTQVSGIGNETARIIVDWESHVDLLGELNEVKNRELKIVIESDDDYPKALRNMHDPPLALYVWGNLTAKDNHAVSMVGSRKTTDYGRETARKLGMQLASSGYSIISGMALGIDTYSHEGAIAAKGRTIAVIGSGLGQIYPPGNMALAEKIASSHGAVVSEFPISTVPDKKTFPMRNRIVAAWGEALIVVECPKWSGSMITANLATEMGKPIYAVPGPIDRPSSEGCNHLIREGATLLSRAEDLLEDFSQLALVDAPVLFDDISHVILPEMSEGEQKVYECLSAEDISLDRLIELTRMGLPQLLPSLLKLEMKKLIRQLPGPRYVITRK